jgi:hypothetical protein
MRGCVLRVRKYIASNFPEKTVSEPTKDSGLDLLVTNQGNARTLKLKVHHSKDYVPQWTTVEHVDLSVSKEFKAAGLFTPIRQQLDQSVADFWVLELSGSEDKYDYVLIPPGELSNRLGVLPDGSRKHFIYVWMTKRGRAWLGRDLNEHQRKSIAENKFEKEDRELTKYLNDWTPVRKL